MYVRSVDVSPPMLSDHSCIIGRLDLLVPQDHSTVRCGRRCWRQFDYEDLCQSETVCDLSTSCSASELFDHYNATLRSLLDIHAPVKTVCVRAAQTAPSYYDDCRREKKETVDLRRFTDVPRKTVIKSCGKFSSSTNGCFFNRNSMATGLQRSTRAEVTQRLYGRNCGLRGHHHRLETQVTSLLMTLLGSSRRRLTRFELQLRALHHL